MIFLNPLMLFGALAGILPVIFHFIYKKKAIPHPFPAVRFLIISQKRSIFLSKLEELLLLFVRLLIIIVIIAIFARPVISSVASVYQGTIPLTVLLIDNSYSMEYKIQDASAFTHGKELAKKFIESASVEERVFLVWTSDEPVNAGDEEYPDKKDMLNEIDKKEISFVEHDLAGILSHAVTLLLKRKGGVKRVIFITDLQKSLWSGSDREALKRISDEGKKNAVEFFIIDMTALKDTSNIAVEDVSIRPRTLNGLMGVEISAKVKNNSQKPVKDVMLTIHLNNKRAAQSFIAIEPGEKAVRSSFISLKEAAAFTGRVVIESNDPLQLDDERYFSFEQASGIKVLIVDGDPRPYSFDSESFYLMSSLQPGPPVISPFEPVVITEDAINVKELSAYDVIVLCNIENIHRRAVDAIVKGVKAGKGVLITLGSHTDPERFNDILKDLLPAPIRGLKTLKHDEYEHIIKKDLNHPLLEIFRFPDSGDFSAAVFKKYFLLKQSYSEDTQYLLTLSKGAPYLVSGNKGRGRTALITSSIDREWNDMPIQTTFLPLMHQTMLYLSNKDKHFQRNLYIGEELEIKVKDGVKGITVTSPGGDAADMKIYHQEDKRAVTFIAANERGIYTINYHMENMEKRNDTVRPFAEKFTVNINTANESNLFKITETELTGIVGEDNYKLVPFEPDKNISASIRKSGTAVHLWPSLIFAAAVLFFAESFLSSRLLPRL